MTATRCSCFLEEISLLVNLAGGDAPNYQHGSKVSSYVAVIPMTVATIGLAVFRSQHAEQ